jgi:hypothetical protein
MALPLGLIMGGLNLAGDTAKAAAQAKFKMISLAVTGGIGVLTLLFTVLN